ncbi:hypothetical protein QYF36_019922 [Acer negundo]|nr:hypothetical protein QYF36_019922 [Acer negundo]
METVHAKTVYGAFTRSSDIQPTVPVQLQLQDTSRHYRPLQTLKKVIDSMAYEKLTQSFPLGIPSYPKLWDRAYSIQERYTMADAAEIVWQVISAPYTA